MQKVVSNSTPIIHLAKIGHLQLLQTYFQRVAIPASVYQECTVEADDRKEIALIKKADFFDIVPVKNSNMVRLLRADLDGGEAEAITLAKEIGADLVLLDDADAREKARILQLKITGTVGILLRAKLEGKISSLQTALNQLKETGFRISESLIALLLKEAGEAGR